MCVTTRQYHFRHRRHIDWTPIEAIAESRVIDITPVSNLTANAIAQQIGMCDTVVTLKDEYLNTEMSLARIK